MATDLTTQIHHYLTTAPASLFSQQPVEMVDHWEGDSNLLWRVVTGEEVAVVKLFMDAGQARSRRQYDGHLFFAPSGLAPTPLWADRYPLGLSRQLIVYRWCEGVAINPKKTGAIQRWATAIAGVHRAPTGEVRRFSPHPLNLDFYWRIEQSSIVQIQNWLIPSGLSILSVFNQLSRAGENLVTSTLPLWNDALPSPVHGDLTHAHSLEVAGQVILLDWELFGLGDPALDVARLLQHEAQLLSKDQIATWLDIYLLQVGQVGLAHRIELYQRLLELHNVFYLLVGLRQNSEGQMDDELKAALPYLQSALTTAMERASHALALSSSPDFHPLITDFFNWLTKEKVVRSSL